MNGTWTAPGSWQNAGGQAGEQADRQADEQAGPSDANYCTAPLWAWCNTGTESDARVSRESWWHEGGRRELTLLLPTKHDQRGFNFKTEASWVILGEGNKNREKEEGDRKEKARAIKTRVALSLYSRWCKREEKPPCFFLISVSSGESNLFGVRRTEAF